MMKKNIWISSICAMLLCTMLGVSSIAASTYSTATLNGETSGSSGSVGLSSQVKTWGRNGPGSSKKMVMSLYGGRAGESLMIQESRSAEPNTDLDVKKSAKSSYDYAWKIKLKSAAKCYGIGKIECID